MYKKIIFCDQFYAPTLPVVLNLFWKSATALSHEFLKIPGIRLLLHLLSIVTKYEQIFLLN